MADVQWLALKGFLPDDRQFRFFPDASATWGDLVEAAVCALDIPMSVTGMHFEGLDPGDRAFRYAETLYDLASRAGIVLFPNMRHPVIDAPADHLRPEPRSRWLQFSSDQPVEALVAEAFLARLLEAHDGPPGPFGAGPPGPTVLSRGALASLVKRAAAGRAIGSDGTRDWLTSAQGVR